jgi:surface antigen
VGFLVSVLVGAGAAMAQSSGADRPPWTRGPIAGDAAPTSASRQQAMATDGFVPVSAIVFPDAGPGTCRRELVGSLVEADALGAYDPARATGTRGNSASDLGRRAAIGPDAVELFVAGDVGRAMDRLDHRCVGQVLEHVPNGRAVTWRNPELGTSFRITATRTYEVGGGRYCRDYAASAVIADDTNQVQGAACRSTGGDWRHVEQAKFE